MFYVDSKYTSAYLCHHGIKGMKWGIRRYQNSDGSLTNEGKKRYAKKMYNVATRRSPLYEWDDDDVSNYWLARRAKHLTKKVITDDQRKKVNETMSKLLKAHEKRTPFLIDAESGMDNWSDNFQDTHGRFPTQKERDAQYNKIKAKYKDVLDEYDKCRDEYASVCNSIAKKLVGEYGDKRLENLRNSRLTEYMPVNNVEDLVTSMVYTIGVDDARRR